MQYGGEIRLMRVADDQQLIGPAADAPQRGAREAGTGIDALDLVSAGDAELVAERAFAIEGGPKRPSASSRDRATPSTLPPSPLATADSAINEQQNKAERLDASEALPDVHSHSTPRQVTTLPRLERTASR